MRLVEGQVIETALYFREDPARRFHQDPVFVGGGHRCRRFSVTVFDGHRQGAAHQVAQVIARSALIRCTKLSSLKLESSPNTYPQEEMRKDQDRIYPSDPGLDDIAQAFGHLALIDIPVAVDVQMPVRLDPGGLSMVAVNAVGFQNIFGDECWATGQKVWSLLHSDSPGGDIVDEASNQT